MQKLCPNREKIGDKSPIVNQLSLRERKTLCERKALRRYKVIVNLQS